MQNLPIATKAECPKKKGRKRPKLLEPKLVRVTNNKLHADGTGRISTQPR